MSVVYFIQVKPHGPIKIGFTTWNVYLRVQTLQHASPHVLEWIGCFPGGKAEERAAHLLLAASRCRNEWFHPTLEVLSFIAEKSPNFCAIKVRDELFFEQQRSVVAGYCRANTSDAYDRVTRIASAAGTDPWKLQKWLSRESSVDPEIAQAACIAVQVVQQAAE